MIRISIFAGIDHSGKSKQGACNHEHIRFKIHAVGIEPDSVTVEDAQGVRRDITLEGNGCNMALQLIERIGARFRATATNIAHAHTKIVAGAVHKFRDGIDCTVGVADRHRFVYILLVGV